jgi:hypothetical protein
MDLARFLWLLTVERTIIGAFSNEVARSRRSTVEARLLVQVKERKKSLVIALSFLPLSRANSILHLASINEISGHVDCSPFSILKRYNCKKNGHAISNITFSAYQYPNNDCVGLANSVLKSCRK